MTLPDDGAGTGHGPLAERAGELPSGGVTSRAAARSAPRPRRSFSWMRLVRRVHLYSGLFLVPLVLLYGVTAFLFNHPAAFSELEVRGQKFGEVHSWAPRSGERSIL